MYATANLIPAKFLILIAHLTIVTAILWNSQLSVKICLPENYTDEHLTIHHTQLVTGLSLTLGFIAFELISFLSGLTMFHTSSALISVGCHSLACLTLGYLIFDSWQCIWYWWIFIVGSVFPTVNDIFIVIHILIRKQY